MQQNYPYTLVRRSKTEESISSMESLNLAEADMLLWIQENVRTAILDHIMPYVSAINNTGFLAITIVIILILWKKYRYVGLTALGALLSEFIIVNIIIKPGVQRIRPFYIQEMLQLLGDLPKDYSFPSGHTGSAFAVATVILLCMPRCYGITAIMTASLIAFSRLYNGAHYPTDVLVGMILGIITGAIATWIYKKQHDRLNTMDGTVIKYNKK